MVRAWLALCLMSAPSAWAQDVMGAVRADRWVDAQTAAASYADPVVRKLVLYYRLLAPQSATLAELEAFAGQNPDWPAQATLARRRDQALAAEPDDAAVGAACDRTLPQSAPALARCADADSRAGRAGDAARVARLAWVASAPDPQWDEGFLQRWPMGPDAQRARFDRLAWTDPAAAARAIASLAAPDQLPAQARLAMRRDDPAATALLAAAGPPTDPGGVLEQLRWLRRAGHDDAAAALWHESGDAAERAAPAERKPLFWDERNVLARHRLRDGDAAGAYAVVTGTSQVAPEQVAGAEFLAGWIALRRLADPVRARGHFAALAALSPAALTQSRGEYWLGRAEAAAGHPADAARAFAVAASWSNTYYGQLAAPDPAARVLAARDPGWTEPEAVAFAGRELARAAAYLVAWGEPRRAGTFLLRLPDVAPAPADLSLAAHLASGFGLPETAVAIARRAGRLGVALPVAGWPVAASVPADAGADPALALAVMRQESSFDTATVSPVGARGLMQLMPGTAATLGRAMGLDASAAVLTGDPAANVRLGTAYLAQMLARFGGSAPLAVAAYNAGPNRVAEWLAASDPRLAAPLASQGSDLDMVDWIELIPFGETRNYVQRVLENAAVYRARLGEPPAATLGAWPSPA